MSYRRHGLARYLRDGCRCDVCTDAYYDTSDMHDRYVYGTEALRAIGADYGITGERVRQVLAMLDPEAFQRRREEKRRRAEAERARLYAERVADNEPCVVCGTFPDTPRQRTCSPWCAEAWESMAVRRLFDPHQCERHNRVIALGHLEREDGSVRHALNILSGNVRSHGRWLLPGSKAWEVAVRAATEGWPTWEQIPEQVRRQVSEALAEAEGVTA